MVASDDLYGGGSVSSKETTAVDRLLAVSGDEDNSPWKLYYEGLDRCNTALESITAMDNGVFSEDNKDWFLGQVHFLRGFFLWELAERYETFPLRLSRGDKTMARASVDEVYAAIADDLTKAIDLIPARYGYTRDYRLAGRATKYAAEALMGRVWLFYTGFYKKSSMAGITGDRVIRWLEDCANTSVSKFDLEWDQREIWPYTNEYSSGFAYGADFGTYSNYENLHWCGNNSKETVWGVHFPFASDKYNRLPEWIGMVNEDRTPDKKSYPYSAGSYGTATVNPIMVREWYEDTDYGPWDKRFYGSVVATCDSRIRKAYPWFSSGYVELPNFTGDDSYEVERTLFYPKKYQAVACYSSGAMSKMLVNFFNSADSFINYIDGTAADPARQRNKNDAIYIRFADVLLMLDELKGTADGMNRIRARAGLPPYSGYTFERLQKERRYEFAFEGMRFNDLRRWYPDTAGEIIQKNQEGGYIEYKGKPSVYKELPGRSFSQRYAQTRGFWMIPDTQIGLSNGQLTQNQGFENGANYLFYPGDLPYE